MTYFAAPGIIRREIKLTINEIEKCVCMYYNIPEKDLHVKTRKASIVRLRQITCYLTRELINMNLIDIGAFYKQDHTTVIHGIKTIQNYIDIYPDFRQEIGKIMEAIRVAGFVN